MQAKKYPFPESRHRWAFQYFPRRSRIMRVFPHIVYFGTLSIASAPSPLKLDWLRAHFLAGFLGQRRRKVPLTRAAPDRHNQLPFIFGTLRHLDRCEHVRPGRDSDQQTLFLRQAPRRHQRVLVAHRDHLIDDLQVQIRRHQIPRPYPEFCAAPGFSGSPFSVWEITGESFGSTAIDLKSGFRSLITSDTPVIVPARSDRGD